MELYIFLAVVTVIIIALVLWNRRRRTNNVTHYVPLHTDDAPLSKRASVAIASRPIVTRDPSPRPYKARDWDHNRRRRRDEDDDSLLTTAVGVGAMSAVMDSSPSWSSSDTPSSSYSSDGGSSSSYSSSGGSDGGSCSSSD